MSTEEQIFFGLILVLGVPAMWRNWTSVALVCSWGICQSTFYLTGAILPLKLFFMLDVAVVAAIFIKSALADYITKYDFVVLALFCAAWLCYVLNMQDWIKFWFLWGIAALQLLVAACEAWEGIVAKYLWKEAREEGSGTLRVVAGHV